jgi:hypothetical protein
MKKSVHINMRINPKTNDLMEAWSKHAGVSKRIFIEELVFALDVLQKNPKHLEELVGSFMYEKYFKN